MVCDISFAKKILIFLLKLLQFHFFTLYLHPKSETINSYFLIWDSEYG